MLSQFTEFSFLLSDRYRKSIQYQSSSVPTGMVSNWWLKWQMSKWAKPTDVPTAASQPDHFREYFAIETYFEKMK